MGADKSVVVFGEFFLFHSIFSFFFLFVYDFLQLGKNDLDLIFWGIRNEYCKKDGGSFDPFLTLSLLSLSPVCASPDSASEDGGEALFNYDEISASGEAGRQAAPIVGEEPSLRFKCFVVLLMLASIGCIVTLFSVANEDTATIKGFGESRS